MAASDSFKFIEKEVVQNLNNINDFLAIYGFLHLSRYVLKTSGLVKSIYQLTKKKIDLKKFGDYAGKMLIDEIYSFCSDD